MAQALLAQGHRVVALSRGAGLDLPEGVEHLTVDLQDSAALASLPRRWDGVVHLAGASIPSLFATAAPVLYNLQITLNLLEHLQESRVLLVSSCHVYAPSSHPRRETDSIIPQGRYGLSKHLVEQLMPHYQERLDIRIARPFNYLGSGQRPELVIPSLLRRLSTHPPNDPSPVLMQGWNSVRDFIDVRDVVSAYLAILDLNAPAERAFNVCTGKAHSIEDVILTVMELLGVNRPIHFQGSPNSLDDSPYLVGDPGRLRSIGWTPHHTLADSLRAMLQAPQNQGKS
jgi:GDP-4-dehydro-6-deoxy-D-mannose reductase